MDIQISNTQNIPVELLETEQWVSWRYEARNGKKPAKCPVAPDSNPVRPANTMEPSTWGSYERACERDDCDGVGFVFTEEDPFIGIDLDDCVNEHGLIEEWAGEIIRQFNSYTEYSPSRTGIHIIAKGTVPEGGARSGNVEMYDSARYFTVTGYRVPGSPKTTEPRQEAVEAVHAAYISEPENESSQVGVSSPRPAPVSLADQELIQKAKNAKNGEKFTRLWDGDTSGYDSHSEADMALCCQLAFWTAKDPTRMDRLFRNSGLMRDKWDTPHFADGRTYGEVSIANALNMVTNYYGN
jgi:primase-polymerase (primpol)-like protein